MRIHLTCSTPRRSLVIALHAIRAVLVRSGHRISLSWPENVEEGGQTRLGFDPATVARADVVVHVCSPEDTDLPAELAAVMRRGKPVVRYEPGPRRLESVQGDATCVVARAEDLADAIANAAASTVGASA